MVEPRFVSGRAVQEYLKKRVTQSPDVLPANRKIYLEWSHVLLSESLSFSRVQKYVQVLMTFERFLHRPFQEATRRDVEEAVINLDRDITRSCGSAV